MFPARVVRRRAQIDHGGLRAQRGKSVAEPLGDEQHSPTGIIELHRLPGLESRRANPQVNDNVHDAAADTAHIFGLPGGHIREMNSPDDALAGHRAVDLRHLEPVTKVTGELIAAEHFKESPALILPDLVLIQPRAIDAKLSHRPANREYFPR